MQSSLCDMLLRRILSYLPCNIESNLRSKCYSENLLELHSRSAEEGGSSLRQTLTVMSNLEATIEVTR